MHCGITFSSASCWDNGAWRERLLLDWFGWCWRCFKRCEHCSLSKWSWFQMLALKCSKRHFGVVLTLKSLLLHFKTRKNEAKVVCCNYLSLLCHCLAIFCILLKRYKHLTGQYHFDWKLEICRRDERNHSSMKLKLILKAEKSHPANLTHILLF